MVEPYSRDDEGREDVGAVDETPLDEDVEEAGVARADALTDPRAVVVVRKYCGY